MYINIHKYKVSSFLVVLPYLLLKDMDPVEDAAAGALVAADSTLALTDTVGDLIGDDLVEPLEKEFTSTSDNQIVDLSNKNNQLTSSNPPSGLTQNVLSQNNYSVIDGNSTGGKLVGGGAVLAGAAFLIKQAASIYHEIFPETQEVEVKEYNEDTNRQNSLDRAMENGENYHQYLPGKALVHNIGNFSPGAIPINNPIGAGAAIPAVAANKSLNFTNPNLPNFNPNMPTFTNRQQSNYNNIVNNYGASHL